jgi:hypothetical protein
MSPASYLTAPPRVAGRIIARVAQLPLAATRAPEEWAENERTQEMVRERIAYHEANAREQEERKRTAADSA